MVFVSQILDSGQPISLYAFGADFYGFITVPFLLKAWFLAGSSASVKKQKETSRGLVFLSTPNVFKSVWSSFPDWGFPQKNSSAGLLPEKNQALVWARVCQRKVVSGASGGVLL